MNEKRPVPDGQAIERSATDASVKGQARPPRVQCRCSFELQPRRTPLRCRLPDEFFNKIGWERPFVAQQQEAVTDSMQTSIVLPFEVVSSRGHSAATLL